MTLLNLQLHLGIKLCFPSNFLSKSPQRRSSWQSFSMRPFRSRICVSAHCPTCVWTSKDGEQAGIPRLHALYFSWLNSYIKELCRDAEIDTVLALTSFLINFAFVDSLGNNIDLFTSLLFSDYLLHFPPLGGALWPERSKSRVSGNDGSVEQTQKQFCSDVLGPFTWATGENKQVGFFERIKISTCTKQLIKIKTQEIIEINYVSCIKKMRIKELLFFWVTVTVTLRYISEWLWSHTELSVHVFVGYRPTHLFLSYFPRGSPNLCLVFCYDYWQDTVIISPDVNR